MIRLTNAQAISRVLRANGYNPGSTECKTGWRGLLCKSSGPEVRVRVWENPDLPEASASDIATAQEIATVLIENGYSIRYATGDYFLYVAGKETKT